MKENTYRVCVVLLLFGILVVQVWIGYSTPLRPVVVGDFRYDPVKPLSVESRRALMERLPMVKVHGDVSVSVDGLPLEVEIQSQPIEVMIVR